ncbi:MAG: ferrous iron transport protein A [bacterium]|nr:ferrous iron transport protein A [bacterium]
MAKHTLAELAPGDVATVDTFGSVGQTVRRIMTLGINPGATVKLIRKAPLGDPLELEVSGCLLTLRAEDAAGVLVNEVRHG